jgi:hypothetical protein
MPAAARDPMDGQSGASILELVREAVEAARSDEQNEDELAEGQRNRERSKRFVEKLAALLEERSDDGTSTYCLSKHNSNSTENRLLFGVNELLYDIAVVETADVLYKSGRPSQRILTYVTACRWAVESELARDARQALLDFNKLVMARADNLLFVGPLVKDVEAYISALKGPASACTGLLHLALIPHPDEWSSGLESAVRVWRWSGADWSELLEPD